MRILVVSDVHSNLAALDAIREEFDACLFLGDLVDYGVQPTECIEWVRKRMTYGVRGNHDHGVAQRVMLGGQSGYRFLTSVTRPINCTLVNETDRRFLADLPPTRLVTLGGKRFFLVHATPRDPFDEYAPPDVEFWKKRLEGIDADYVCVGHTHVQYALQVGKTTVLNPGSAGLPRDGDPRSAYVIVTESGPELKRVSYDVERAIESIRTVDIPDSAKTMLAEAYRQGRLEKKNGHTAVRVNGTAETPNPMVSHG